MATKKKKTTTDTTTNAARTSAKAVSDSKNAYFNSLSESKKAASLYNQIANRKDFTYNPSTDVLYNKYKKVYQQQGKTAMEDTVGTASALTGGYASSYAQSQGAGQYRKYLDEFEEKTPTYYEKAYQKYQDDGKKLEELYNLEKQRDTENSNNKKAIYETNQKNYNEDIENDRKDSEAKQKAKEADRKATETERKNKASEAEKKNKRLDNKANNQSKINQSEKKAARDTAMAVIKTGNVPENALLKKSGISSSTAKTLAKYYKSLLNKAK